MFTEGTLACSVGQKCFVTLSTSVVGHRMWLIGEDLMQNLVVGTV